ncbi:MAG: hypothetical protein NT062_19085 [Proteobacteria bacterium]|nr:hypothetical protein [Pseudomonadota bacterium]
MTRLALLLIALAACRREPAIPVEDRLEPPKPVAAASAPGSPIPADTDLVLALVDDWTSTTATLRRWHHHQDTWMPIGESWSGVIGRAGTAWGAGLHGVGAPADRTGPVKREGDGKSPAGAFAIRGAFGYAPSESTLSSFQQVDANWKCVDDSRSTSYAKIVDARTVTVDWTSAEDLRRPDALYTFVIDVAHNAARTPNAGSCIFLHVWSGPDSTTSGCTAMPLATMQWLVETLPATATYVLLPRAEYAALKTTWQLP